MPGETHHVGTFVLLSRALWQIQILRDDIVVLVPFATNEKKSGVERDDEILMRTKGKVQEKRVFRISRKEPRSS